MDNNTTIKSEAQDAANGLPVWKRVFDFALLLVTMPVWVPVWVVSALAVRFGSLGPIFFKQARVGYRGQIFTCYKFRTMKANIETTSHQKHVKALMESATPMTKLDAANDSRMVPFANWIRASGLDELPQIINIVRGEMSIVGPRPCIPFEYELYKPEHRARCNAAPGLTGLWQVSGKNRLSFERMIALDVEYSQRKSLWLDARIVLLTGPAILQQVGDLISAKRARKAGKSGKVSKVITGREVASLF
jgi:lipopolysaccharide/colanic/teichoic acid biosynthesis glycosyltransferase